MKEYIYSKKSLVGSFDEGIFIAVLEEYQFWKKNTHEGITLTHKTSINGYSETVAGKCTRLLNHLTFYTI